MNESDVYLSDDNDAGVEQCQDFLENMFQDEYLDEENDVEEHVNLIQENYVEEKVYENSDYDTEDELPLSEVKRRLDQKKEKKNVISSTLVTKNHLPMIPSTLLNLHEFWIPLDYFSQYSNDDFFKSV